MHLCCAVLALGLLCTPDKLPQTHACTSTTGSAASGPVDRHVNASVRPAGIGLGCGAVLGRCGGAVMHMTRLQLLRGLAVWGCCPGVAVSL
jgi:hypothetical protein